MYEERLARQLLAPSPHIVVMVGEPIFRLSKPLHKISKEPGFTAAIPMFSQFDLVDQYIEASKAAKRNIAHSTMCLDLPTNTSAPADLLGLACRASPRLLLVEHTSSSADEMFSDEQFFAFGFRVVEKLEDAGLSRALYAYSLSDYKQAPDWLNARFWAHPERFDLSE